MMPAGDEIRPSHFASAMVQCVDRQMRERASSYALELAEFVAQIA